MARYLILLFLFFNTIACAQNDLAITQSGIEVSVVNKEFPLIKILLPGQPATERGIEVEFPEHVTGKNLQSRQVGHLYLVSNGQRNKRSNPVWKKEGNVLMYETTFNDHIKMMAKVEVETDGVSYTYTITNNSTIGYENLQAVTCIKLYSAFSDTLLTRTYVHHANGFDLLASETPERLTMPLDKWLPCRYLVSYTWPVPAKRMEKDADSITRYYKSRKVDWPLIATTSHDGKWIAATYTKETGNLWTNPERTCHHADPAISLQPGETKTLQLKTILIKGGLKEVEQLFQSHQ
jgi:hypothetical protein